MRLLRIIPIVFIKQSKLFCNFIL